eukprot:GHVH01004781.1.p1 GENE.GHVH01004781.1~~GHVH01004781.1.p1  ORF type:complete len:867 (+),score=110.90 GHVH01004781.1:273-2873(+)
MTGEWENWDDELHGSGTLQSESFTKPQIRVTEALQSQHSSHHSFDGDDHRVKFDESATGQSMPTVQSRNGSSFESVTGNSKYLQSLEQNSAAQGTLGGFEVSPQPAVFHCNLERTPKSLKPFRSTSKLANWVPVTVQISSGTLFIFEQMGNGGFNKFLHKAIHLSNSEKLEEDEKLNRKYAKKNLPDVIMKIGHRIATGKGMKTKVAHISLKFPNQNIARSFSMFYHKEIDVLGNRNTVDSNIVTLDSANKAFKSISNMLKSGAAVHLFQFEKRLEHFLIISQKREAFNRARNFGHQRECDKIRAGVIRKSDLVDQNLADVQQFDLQRHSVEKLHIGCAVFDQFYRKRMTKIFLTMSFYDKTIRLDGYLTNIKMVMTTAVDYSVQLYADHIKSARKAKLATLFRTLWLKRELDALGRILEFSENVKINQVNLHIASKHLTQWLKKRHRLGEGGIVSHWLGVARNESRKQGLIRSILEKRDDRQLVNSLRQWSSNIISMMDRDAILSNTLVGVLEKSKERILYSTMRVISAHGLMNISKKNDEDIKLVSTVNACIKSTLDCIPKERCLRSLSELMLKVEKDQKIDSFAILKWRAKYRSRLYSNGVTIGVNLLEQIIKRDKKKAYLSVMKCVRERVVAKSISRKSYYQEVQRLAASKLVASVNGWIQSSYNSFWRRIANSVVVEEVVVIDRDVVNEEDHKERVLEIATGLGVDVLGTVIQRHGHWLLDDAWSEVTFKLRDPSKPWNPTLGARRGGKGVPFVSMKPGPPHRRKKGQKYISWYNELWENAPEYPECPLSPVISIEIETNYREELLGFTPLTAFAGNKLRAPFKKQPVRRSYFDLVWLLKLSDKDERGLEDYSSDLIHSGN